MDGVCQDVEVELLARAGILKGLTQTRGWCLPCVCLSVNKRPRVLNVKASVDCSVWLP